MRLKTLSLVAALIAPWLAVLPGDLRADPRSVVTNLGASWVVPYEGWLIHYVEERAARADLNGDGDRVDEMLHVLDLSDAVCTFGVLFLGRSDSFPCGDGGADDEANVALLDWQPDGSIDLSDGLSALQYFFSVGLQHPCGTACVPLLGCPESCEPRRVACSTQRLRSTGVRDARRPREFSPSS